MGSLWTQTSHAVRCRPTSGDSLRNYAEASVKRLIFIFRHTDIVSR